MTIFERITNMPFYAILNAPITLMVAGKLLNVIIAYIKQQYLSSDDSSNAGGNESGDHHHICPTQAVLAGVLDDNNDGN